MKDTVKIPGELIALKRHFQMVLDRDGTSWEKKFYKNVSGCNDLSLIWPKFCIFMLSDKDYGVLQFAKANKFSAISCVGQGSLNLLYPWVETGIKPRKSHFKVIAAQAVLAAANTGLKDWIQYQVAALVRYCVEAVCFCSDFDCNCEAANFAYLAPSHASDVIVAAGNDLLAIPSITYGEAHLVLSEKLFELLKEVK